MGPSPEASWLGFNRRVLLQARRPDFPPLERLAFLGIWANNLDEFFAARISRAFAQERGQAAYRALLAEALAQAGLAHRLYRALLQEIRGLGLEVLAPAGLTPAELRYFGAYLAEEVAPRTDLIPREALGDLSSRALYLAAGGEEVELLIRIPEGLPRLLPVPGRRGAFVRLGELIRLRSDLFLPKPRPLYELRVVRLAELERDRVDWEDLPEALEARLDGRVVHLEVEEAFPEAWARVVRGALGLLPEEVFRLPLPLDLRLAEALAAAGPAGARFPPLRPKRPRRFLQDPFGHLEGQDLLLYHPCQDYRAVEAFLEAAARDPGVRAIRATLYRLGPANPIAEALIRAAQAGKEVAVLLEGRARFDELQNLYWSLRFQGAGVRVLPLPEKKVHAKALWVERAGRAYAHLGTGNYNPLSGARYTDLSLFTADPRLTEEVAAFFRALEGGEAPRLDLLRTGPGIRETLLEAIRGEAHPGGWIILKCNHLTDPPLLEALKEAALKGARVDLIVRSTLTLLHPRFRVRSLVGRFLEHARMAAFRDGGRWRVWAGSADLMPRNLDRRYELLFPILDPRAKAQALRILRRQLLDTANAFLLGPEGDQEPRWGEGVDAQACRTQAGG